MKKSTLISTLAVAAITMGSLALPGTASASSFKHDAERAVSSVQHQQRDHNVRRVHDTDRRYTRRHRDHGHTRWAPSHRHDRGHHHGHRKHVYRYDYRPVERYRHRHDDDLRVRIYYDLHL